MARDQNRTVAGHQKIEAKPPATVTLQRQCACGQHTRAGGECTECKKNRLQRKIGSPSEPSSVPPSVHEVLRSPGQPLATTARAFMEPRFGHDFSQVRVHTGARAANSAQEVNALAYTVGQDIVFGPGQYSPGTRNGRRVLAHELTHTIQQTGVNTVSVSKSMSVSQPSDASEREAEAQADRVLSGDENAIGSVQKDTNTPGLQRLGDLSKVPPMVCDVANSSPASVFRNIFFGRAVSALSPTQKLDVEAVVHSWYAARSTPIIRVDGYASTEGSDDFNWKLSCDRAFAVANELVTPSSGVPGIPATHVEFFAQGETFEFSPALPPNRRAAISTTAPLPAPICTHPGESRTLDLQPVFFQSSATDAAPTGGSWGRRLDEANRIWGKLGVTFHELTPITLTDATNKTAGTTLAEYHAIRATRTGAGVEVFMVDNDLAFLGGGGTVNGGTANAQIVLSDRGTSDTLLAHELGHVLGLGHPPGAADTDTILTPSSSHSTDNPRRNTMDNYGRITFPAATGSTCLEPDP